MGKLEETHAGTHKERIKPGTRMLGGDSTHHCTNAIFHLSSVSSLLVV